MTGKRMDFGEKTLGVVNDIKQVQPDRLGVADVILDERSQDAGEMEGIHRKGVVSGLADQAVYSVGAERTAHHRPTQSEMGILFKEEIKELPDVIIRAIAVIESGCHQGRVIGHRFIVRVPGVILEVIKDFHRSFKILCITGQYISGVQQEGQTTVRRFDVITHGRG